MAGLEDWPDKPTILRAIGDTYKHWVDQIETCELPGISCPLCVATTKAVGSVGKCDLCPVWVYSGNYCSQNENYEGYRKAVDQLPEITDDNYEHCAEMDAWITAKGYGEKLLDSLMSLWLLALNEKGNE